MLSKSKQPFHNQTVRMASHSFGAVTHNERQFQFRFLNRLFRIVPGFMGISFCGRRQNVRMILAQVPEQSKFTYSAYLVAARHLVTLNPSPTPLTPTTLMGDRVNSNRNPHAHTHTHARTHAYTHTHTQTNTHRGMHSHTHTHIIA